MIINYGGANSGLAGEALRMGLPFLAAVAGWYVASRLQDKRERRKEIRSLIEYVKELIEETYVLTLAYYADTQNKHIGEESAKITFKLNTIAEHLQILEDAGLPVDMLDQYLEFKQAITGDFFETPRFRERLLDSSWQSSLASSANGITRKLDVTYFGFFPMRVVSRRLIWKQRYSQWRVQRVDKKTGG